MAATPRFTIFYAWQDDTDPTTNRYFIQKMLEKAAKTLSSNELDVVVDSDTQGLTGWANIPEAILMKIGSCDVFLGDATFVASVTAKEQEEQSKGCPNPNVMYELGFAHKTIGENRIVLVGNNHYAKKLKVPFDMNHRRYPIAYCLAPGENKEGVAETLLSALVKAVGDIITDHGIRPENIDVAESEWRFELAWAIAEILMIDELIQQDRLWSLEVDESYVSTWSDSLHRLSCDERVPPSCSHEVQSLAERADTAMEAFPVRSSRGGENEAQAAIAELAQATNQIFRACLLIDKKRKNEYRSTL